MHPGLLTTLVRAQTSELERDVLRRLEARQHRIDAADRRRAARRARREEHSPGGPTRSDRALAA
ncbi:hypothetical protein [Actinorugispora endophytica]|uniref:Uncharacterized protein n=1 Tax=Actinorugispora endophytica TaxID=1605990 RepID=A0A4R6V205_9ACTN|nr:hypothetical protein [Actinorugispora endophytica]TDQ52465.1 hypothetical protein EV190_106103 [Actinorugispora endophytica]